MITSRFFSDKELACKCNCGKGLQDMDQSFINRLDMLRTSVGTPLVITSGMRCNNWNQKCKGQPKSQHLIGKAVDIACAEADKRWKLVTCATSLGLSCGIDGSFVHVDSRDSVKVMFLYPLKGE